MDAEGGGADCSMQHTPRWGHLNRLLGGQFLTQGACWVVSAEAEDIKRLLLLLTRHVVVLLFRWC